MSSLKQDGAAGRAKMTLTHYFRTVWCKAGIQWDGDNETEIAAVVDDLITAATPGARLVPDKPPLLAIRNGEYNCQTTVEGEVQVLRLEIPDLTMPDSDASISVLIPLSILDELCVAWQKAKRLGKFESEVV